MFTVALSITIGLLVAKVNALDKYRMTQTHRLSPLLDWFVTVQSKALMKNQKQIQPF